MVRTISVGLLVIAVSGWLFAADPVPKVPSKLGSELEALQKERKEVVEAPPTDDPNSERVRLRNQLLEMIRKLGDKQKFDSSESTAPKPREVVSVPRPKFEFPVNGTLDTLRMAQNLYKAGEVDAALRAFNLLEEKGVASEDRLFVQYMKACCLRKTGKLGDAQVIFRDISVTNDDAFLKESALWQLSMMKSTQELESQLEQLRSRRKTR